MSVLRHVFRKLLALLTPAVFSLPASRTAPAAEIKQPSAFVTLARRIRTEPATRALFAQNPHAVLREAGIDPEPFDIAASLSDSDLNRLMERWRIAEAGIPGQATGAASPDSENRTPQAAPAPVYGPPPIPRPPSPPGPRPPDALSPPAAPQTAVYGPPPGRR